MPFLPAAARLALILTIAVPFASPAQTAAPRSAPPLPAGLNPGAYPGTMTLDVDASDVARGIFTVRQTIPVTAGPLVLRYPEWLPGKHGPRGAVGDIAGLVIRANGRPLAWTRDPANVFAFALDVPAGVRTIDLSFQFLSPTRPSEGRVVATPAMLNLAFEQVSFYPAGYATRNIQVQPSVTLPAGWTGVAALDGATVNGNRIRYGVTDYETLIDSPMFAGAYFRKWDLGQSVTLNVVADEARFLDAKPEHIAVHRALVDEAVILFGSRHFDRYEFLLALTDELGGIGLEHHRSSENSRDTNYFTEWATTGSARGLLPHELTHSWNGKFRRPAGLWTPDYDVPMDDRLLWVYEGQTSYWDLVLAARSGMQTPEMVLGEWARYAAIYQAQPGRAWRSVEDTTLDPIIAARRSRPFPSATRTEDYYNEGSLVWLEADMLIRERSGGTRSLDDFARGFFGIRDGDWGTVPYTFDDVVAALNAVQPYDWADFLTTRMRQPGQPAPLGGIERGGYRLVFRDVPNVYDAERMKLGKSLDLSFSIGVVIDKAGEVTAVQFGGPMFEQGVTNGTKILAVNGMAYSEERLKAAIEAAGGVDGARAVPMSLLVERGGRFRTIDWLWTGGLRWPHLERTNVPPRIDALLAARRPVAPAPPTTPAPAP